jgi:uracil-DNA glycosylase
MTWNEMLQNEINQDYYANGIAPFLKEEYEKYECYPPKENIFSAFYSIPSPEDVKVIIIGQDPYHEPGQANGLAFSVQHDCLNPPSLKNIITEIYDNYSASAKKECNDIDDGDLTFLAEQGVLLLNATLTVRKGEANSHANCGWQIFTDNIIRQICELGNPLVFMLWGKFAQKKENLIMNTSNTKTLVLKTSHPSPFSANRGFLGCKHFAKCNSFLVKNGISEINWLKRPENLIKNEIPKETVISDIVEEHEDNITYECDCCLDEEQYYNNLYEENCYTYSDIPTYEGQVCKTISSEESYVFE